jgi:Tfp pilus assembly protein PilN
MRAVNLIPNDAKRGGGAGLAGKMPGPGALVIAALAVAVLFVTIYVLTGNTISERTAKMATLQAQANQAQQEAARLAPYTQFAQLAQTRAETVREIAATRFDWHAALADLSRVVPANTSLVTLFGSVAPGASVAGSSGSSGGGTATLRADIPSPAFEMSGCTQTQDDVARLMSRLRLINGVTRVTVADTTKPDSAGAGSSSTTSVNGGNSSGCGDGPGFDLVVFFSPLPGAGPSGVTSLSTQNTSATTPGATK